MLDQRSKWVAVIKDYCNNDFDGVADDNLPTSIIAVLDELLLDSANRVVGVSSKTSQGLVVESYTTEDLSPKVKAMLRPYRSMRGFVE